MFCNGYYFSLRKTKEIDINDASHPLPPDGGAFEEFRVADYFCPDEWSRDAVFVKIKDGEPFWIDFRQNPYCACLLSIQKVNPVTGEPANIENGLSKDPKQNYLWLSPTGSIRQLWLDGYANDGKVYQFKATKAGESLAVNEYVLPVHMQDSHALGFAFFAPKVMPTPPSAPIGLHFSSFDADNVPISKKSGAFAAHAEYFLQHDFQVDVCASEPSQNGCSTGEFSASPLKKRMKKYGSARGQSVSFSAAPQVGEAQVLTALTPACAPSVQGDLVGKVNYCEEVSLMSADVDLDDGVDRLAEAQELAFAKASVGAGGRIQQRIVPDPNTVDFYQEKPAAILTVYLALPEQFESIMKKGKRQDANRKDKYVHSGNIGGIQVPLIKSVPV